MTFEGNTVWITGASSGIGAALARGFAAEGARLVLSARRDEQLQLVRDSCARPDDHSIVSFDLSDASAVTEAARHVLANGHVDILVNNGGISQRAKVVETGLDVDRRIMEINYFAAVALAKAVLPSMLVRRSGHIVVMSSLAGKFGVPRRSAYSASKHALHGFFDVLRTETHDTGLQVTVVCPGFVRTDISQNALQADGSQYGLMDQKQADGLDPDTCAQRILQAVRRKETEVYIGGTEVLGVYLRRFLPGLFARIIRRSDV